MENLRKKPCRTKSQFPLGQNRDPERHLGSQQCIGILMDLVNGQDKEVVHYHKKAGWRAGPW